MEITVKVGPVPGRITDYAVASPATVRSVLEVAGFGAAAGYTIKKNGSTVSLDASICDGDTVLLIKGVNAGR
jgi:hypothetical protein